MAVASRYYCHDLSRSSLTCFTSSLGRDRAVGKARQTLGVESTGYVIAWENSWYGGSSVVLSQNYASLVGIGWNDRISSYKVYTGYTGGFYENINYGGRLQSFCCNQQISYVGDLYNDTFSSMALP